MNPRKVLIALVLSSVLLVARGLRPGAARRVLLPGRDEQGVVGDGGGAGDRASERSAKRLPNRFLR